MAEGILFSSTLPNLHFFINITPGQTAHTTKEPDAGGFYAAGISESVQPVTATSYYFTFKKGRWNR